MSELISRRHLRNFDYVLLGFVLLLFLVGIINLKSAGAETGIWKYQLVWFSLGCAVMLIFAFIDYHRLESLAIIFYLLCLGLLVLVLFVGKEIHHSRSWLVFKGFRIQPSELAKLAVVIYLARIYHRRETAEPMGLRQIIYPLLIILVPAGLIALEPDLGTTFIYLIFGAMLLIFMGIRKKLLIFFIALTLALTPICWRYILKPHQKARIITFIKPEKDPLGAGYNLLQSKIAIGSGGFFGKGWQKGTQNMLRFLPEQHTDFAFSVWAEEWGFVPGVIPVILLYLFIFSRGLGIASQAKDKFGLVLCLGAVSVMFSHFLVNLAMISGCFPVIGVPLPFFSYGGSHLVVCCAFIGLILSVGMRRYVF